LIEYQRPSLFLSSILHGVWEHHGERAKGWRMHRFFAFAVAIAAICRPYQRGALGFVLIRMGGEF
jgi:hypothetical protein